MKRVFALSVVCALMAACESESDSSTSYPDISDYAYIDLGSDNASANVSSALRGVGNSASGEDVDLPGDEAAAISALALAQGFASDYFKASTRQSRVASQAASVDCGDGGTLSIEIQGDLTSSGDWVQATFNNCLEDGMLSNGGLRIVVGVNSILGSDLSATYHGLSVTEAGVSATLNGDLRMAWQRSGTELTSVMSSSSLNMVSSEGGNTVISDLEVVQVKDSATLNSSLDIDYDIASDELAGRVSFDTVQSLVYEGGIVNPSTGILKLSGANDSSVTLDAFTGDVDTVLMTVNNGSSVTSEVVRWDSIADSDLTGLANF